MGFSRWASPCLVTLCLSITSPMALGYNGHASNEPESLHDQRTAPGGYPYLFTERSAFLEPGKIYFDAVLVGDQGTLPYNQATGGRVLGPTEATFVAYLGYWQDCNGDGYIGDAATGLYLYESADGNQHCSDPGPHIHNTLGFGPTVYEFIPIGDLGGVNGVCEGCDMDRTGRDPEEGGVIPCSGGANLCFNPLGEYNHVDDPVLTVNDSRSKVWGDWEVPEKALPTSGVLPLPPGTLTTTGGHIKYVDTLTDHAIRDTVFLTPDGPSTWNDLTCARDGNDPLPILWSNPTPGYSPDDASCGSLNFENPVGYLAREAYNNRVSNDPGVNNPGYYNDGSTPWVSMNWNCDNPVGDPSVRQFAAPGVPASNINVNNNPPYGSLNGQLAEIDHGYGSTKNGQFQCTYAPQEQLPYGSLESGAQADSWVRSKHDYSFNFLPRGYDEYDLDGNGDSDRVDLAVWGGSGGYWQAREAIYLTRKHATFANRPLTFYATISEMAFRCCSVPPGASKWTSTPAGDLVVDIYGREGCIGTGTSVGTAWVPDHVGTGASAWSIQTGSGWECNQAVWEWTSSTANGNSPETTYTHVPIGTPYTFRDIDCYDNYTGINPVYLSTAALLGDCKGKSIV